MRYRSADEIPPLLGLPLKKHIVTNTITMAKKQVLNGIKTQDKYSHQFDYPDFLPEDNNAYLATRDKRTIITINHHASRAAIRIVNGA